MLEENFDFSTEPEEAPEEDTEEGSDDGCARSDGCEMT